MGWVVAEWVGVGKKELEEGGSSRQGAALETGNERMELTHSVNIKQQ